MKFQQFFTAISIVSLLLFLCCPCSSTPFQSAPTNRKSRSTPNYKGDGLFLASCNSTDQNACRQGQCYLNNDASNPFAGRTHQPCYPPSFPCTCHSRSLRPTICKDSSVCRDGTRCASIPDGEDDPQFRTKTCISCTSSLLNVSFLDDGGDNCKLETKPSSNIIGGQFDVCTINNATSCTGDRHCYEFDRSIYYSPKFCAKDSKTCVCLYMSVDSYPTCSSKKSSQCMAGARCASILGSNKTPFCASCGTKSASFKLYDDGNCTPPKSPGPSPSPSPSSSPILSPSPSNVTEDPAPCIAIDSLQSYPSEKLVFTHPKRATVFCDLDKNCATPGHVVEYRGTPMMMKTYCEQHPVQCERKIMYVNSPRMKAGLRLGSRSNDLQFTALSARYMSKTEEGIIRFVLRFV